MKIKPTSEKAKSAPKVSSRSHLGERVPRLRFPGFEGEWEEQCLETFMYSRDERQIPSPDAPLMAFIAKLGVAPKGERYDREYLVKSKDKEYKRTEFNDFIYSSNNLDVGSIGLNKYGRAVISDVYEIFTMKDGYAPEFISELVQRPRNLHKVLRFRQGCLYGQYRIYASDFLSVKLLAPDNEEQFKIAGFLQQIDTRITAQRRLVELLKKHKRGVIEQIFGRRLDMGKDAEKWDIVELRDLFSKVARRNRGGKVKNVITNSAEFGLIPQRDFFDKSIAVDGNTDGYYVIRTGDFVYNPRKSTTAPFGPFNRYTGTEDGIISPLYTCLVPKGKANPEYLAWYFRSTAWHRYVYDNGSQGARHDRVNMTDDLLFGIPVLLPPIAVQERIADGLNAIDARWSSANKVLAHLEKMKRGLLQQLFA